MNFNSMKTGWRWPLRTYEIHIKFLIKILTLIPLNPQTHRGGGIPSAGGGGLKIDKPAYLTTCLQN